MGGPQPQRLSPRTTLAKDAASTAESARKLTERGIAFLRPRQDAKGGWSTQREPGITALVVTALLRSGQVAPGEPAVTKALAYLEGFIGPKGGLSEAPHANYSTSIALLAFREANTNGRYDRTIKAGQDFLKTMQWDESEGKTRDDAFYGGAGYGGSNSRPDLSNTAFFIEALRETGLPADDPNLQKAIVFVSRCQNLKSEFNDQPWASKVNDGGFVYTAANGGQSMAGQARRRRPPLVCQHDLRRPQEHDLRRPDSRRPPRQGGLDLHHQALHARREPRAGPTRALLLLPHLRQDDGRARRADAAPTRRESPTTGGPSWSRPSPSGNSPKEAGSTRPTGSWKATRTW